MSVWHLLSAYYTPCTVLLALHPYLLLPRGHANKLKSSYVLTVANIEKF